MWVKVLNERSGSLDMTGLQIQKSLYGSNIIVTQTNAGKLYFINISNGETLYTIDMCEGIGAGPLISGDVIYLTNGNNKDNSYNTSFSANKIYTITPFGK